MQVTRYIASQSIASAPARLRVESSYATGDLAAVDVMGPEMLDTTWHDPDSSLTWTPFTADELVAAGLAVADKVTLSSSYRSPALMPLVFEVRDDAGQLIGTAVQHFAFDGDLLATWAQYFTFTPESAAGTAALRSSFEPGEAAFMTKNELLMVDTGDSWAAYPTPMRHVGMPFATTDADGTATRSVVHARTLTEVVDALAKDDRASDTDKVFDPSEQASILVTETVRQVQAAAEALDATFQMSVTSIIDVDHNHVGTRVQTFESGDVPFLRQLADRLTELDPAAYDAARSVTAPVPNRPVRIQSAALGATVDPMSK